jgi:adenylate kinase
VTSQVASGPATATGRADRQIIIMLGAPGAGKGTQAKRLAAALGLPHVSTGDLFRAALRNGHPLGDQVRRYVEKGALVPDELTIEAVRERLALADARDGAILDGFPRTRRQAEALDELLASQGDRVTAALYVEVDAPDLVHRLAGRRVCTAPGQHVYHVTEQPPAEEGVCDVDAAPLVQRRDDREDTVRARLERQLPPMYEVIDHYADRGVLFAVPGAREIDEVTADLLSVLSATTRPR